MGIHVHRADAVKEDSLNGEVGAAGGPLRSPPPFRGGKVLIRYLVKVLDYFEIG